MICKKCGNEIEEGKLFCDICLEPVDLVPEYSELDEEILHTFVEDPKITQQRLKEQKLAEKKATEDASNSEEQSIPQVMKDSFLHSRKIRLSILVIALLFASVIAISISLYQNSYHHQYALGVKCDNNEEYESAITHYLFAVEKDSASIEARMAAANDYMMLQEYNSAERLLKQVLALNSSYSDAYYDLVQIYSIKNNVDGIKELKKTAVTEEVKAYIDSFLRTSIEFSIPEGEYSDDLSLYLSTEGEGDIYYTLDGSVPSVSNGTLYTDAIKIKDGKTTVNAMLVNDGVNAGILTTKEYTVSYVAPPYPEVTPPSGTYTEETLITINPATENSVIYYTWDDTIPNVDSFVYTDPIPMPEGNNVLSVIVVDSHGLASDILKLNYRYLP